MTEQYPNPMPSQPAPAAQAPKPTRFGGLAWTALIIGIVGLVFSLIPLLNIVSALAAAVGIILGIIAFFGTRKIVAVIGVVLCIAAIAATVAVNGKAAEELDKAIGGSANQGQVSDGSTKPAEGQQATDKPAADAPTWGKRYTWKDGLAVEVSAPVACVPSRTASPQNIQRAVKFTITVTNGAKQPFDTTLLSFGNDVQFNGAKAERVFDSSGECGGDLAASTVMPGKSFAYDVAYAVGPQPGEMQLVLSPGFAGDKAVFTGQA